MSERRSRSASVSLEPPSVNQNDQVKGHGKSPGRLHPLGTRSNPNLWFQVLFGGPSLSEHIVLITGLILQGFS